MWSTERRVVVRSYSRGTTATATPSSSQRRTSRSRTSFGAVENVMITCSTPCSRTTCSRSQLAPSTGSTSPLTVVGAADPCRGSRSASARAAGWSSSRCAVSRPTRPAPTIERRAKPLARQPGPALRPVERDPPGGDVRGREQPEPERLVDRRSPSRRRPRRSASSEIAAKPGRADDAPQIVDRAHAEAAP